MQLLIVLKFCMSVCTLVRVYVLAREISCFMKCLRARNKIDYVLWIRQYINSMYTFPMNDC